MAMLFLLNIYLIKSYNTLYEGVNMNKIEIAIIPVAGRGTRYYPITKYISKTMFPLYTKPIIYYIIEEIINADIKEIIIVVNETQKDIINYINDLRFQNINIHIVYQNDYSGIGGAILCCKQYIDNRDFCVLLGDDLVLSNTKQYGIKSLIDQYQNNKATYIGVKQIEIKDTYKYGIVKHHNQTLIYINEKPKFNPPSNLAIIGRYIFTNNFIQYLESLNKDNELEIKITDALNNMVKDHQIYITTFNGNHYDIGDYGEYILANIDYCLSKKISVNKIKNRLQN